MDPAQREINQEKEGAITLQKNNLVVAGRLTRNVTSTSKAILMKHKSGSGNQL